jgi:predicted CoA-binding protein
MKSQSIKSFIQLKNIAVIGVSRTGKGFGAAVYNHLKNNGYTVFAVNRIGGFSNNIKLYPSLFKIDHPIDGIITIVPPAETEDVIRVAFDLNITNVWMQQGSSSKDAINFCKEKEINFISDECILMFAEPVRSIHKIHKWINKLVGKYPRMDSNS